ncbi:MAG TPA: TonB-dependent receptor [Rhodothermales bacterium]|nr:TonB-dependent receptor [Rhodothermales bacterium]
MYKSIFRRRTTLGWSSVVLLTILPGTVWSQVIEGRVRDFERQPLPGVTVVVPALQIGAVTDEEGRYTIVGLPVGAHTVEFRFLGFETSTHTVVVAAERLTLNVILRGATLLHEEVVKTADGVHDALNRATLSVSRLDPEDVEMLRGQTLGETLEHLAGVTTMTTGPSIAKPVIRGLHSQRVLILNAGIPQEGQQWGGEHAPEIDPFAPVRIEVVRGAAGVEYGVGAIGGVIRLEPRELPTGPVLRGSLTMNGFSNNRQGAGSILLEGGLGALPGMGWRAQGSFRKAGASQTSDYVIGNSGFQELDGTVAVGYHGARLGLDVHYSHFGTELGLFKGAHIGNYDDLLRAIERGQPGVEYDFSYGIEPPKQSVAHDLLALRGGYVLDSGDRVETQYGLQRNRRQEFDAHRRFGDPLEDPAFDLTLTTHTLDVKFKSRPRGSFFGVVGISGMNQGNVNVESGYLIPNFRALTGGGYARLSWVNGPWVVETGTRFDYRWLKAYPRLSPIEGFTRRTHSYRSLSGVIGAIRQIARSWSIAANIGTAWRPPGVNELYNFGVHHGTAQFEVGNPEIGSERSYSLDVTLRHASERASMEASAFNNWMDGYIHLFPEPEPKVTIRGTFPSFRYAQTDAVLRGFDASVEYRALDFLAFAARGSLVRGDDRTTDVPLISMPADRLTLSTSLAMPNLGPVRESKINLESTFVNRQTSYPDGVDYADPPPGYTLVGVGYSAVLMWWNTPVRFSVSVENLFNEAYRDYLSRFRYFIDDPGRNVVFRVHVPLGTPDP